MIEKTVDFLSGLRMTLLSGVFLAASLALLLTQTTFFPDPVWATIFISGLPLLYNAVTKLFLQGRITSSLLITIAMCAAIAIGEAFAAGEVAFIMAIGSILEDRTANRARKGIQQLINLAPRKGRKLEGNREIFVETEDIRSGDLLRVLPGESIPVDGVIVSGHTTIDQSVMTGESLPVNKEPGDEVLSGTINRFGVIEIRATRTGEDSSLQKMIRLVEEAEKNKAPMQRIADKWASWLVPAALVIAIITHLVTGDIIRAVTVLVVFCPCALALATPTSIMAAIGQGTRNGVLIKSGEALEKMGKVNCIAFDKTGTLTRGIPTVSDIVSLSGEVSENSLLSLTASVETGSEHPLGKAIVSYAKEEGVFLSNPQNFDVTPGKGIRALVNGQAVLCGNQSYLKDQNIPLTDEATNYLSQFRSDGKATILVAREGVCIGILALSDALRPVAAEAIGKLKEIGVTPLILTGDHREAAGYLAKQAGIEEIRSELLPAQKLDCIRELQAKDFQVGMVGDGVNDAPALKAADVGIAMGSMGSDIAMEAADIALMGEDLNKIPYLKKLSNATISSIKFNITIAMAINFIAIGLSVTGLLNPVTGALVHNIGSILVILNAASLYNRKFIDS